MSLKRLFAKFQKTAKNSVFGPIWPKMSDIWPILDLFYSIWTLFDPLLMYFWRLCKGIYPWFEGPKWVKVNPLNRILDQNVVNNPDILVDNPDLSVMFLEIGINTPNILLNNPICTTWLAHAYWLIESRLDGVGSSFRVLMMRSRGVWWCWRVISLVRVMRGYIHMIPHMRWCGVDSGEWISIQHVNNSSIICQ